MSLLHERSPALLRVGERLVWWTRVFSVCRIVWKLHWESLRRMTCRLSNLMTYHFVPRGGKGQSEGGEELERWVEDV